MSDRTVSTAQPKSILKNKTASPTITVPPNVNIPPPKTDKEVQHLRTALYHAHQVQAQKRLGLEILEAIEALSLLPAGPVSSPTEAEQFTSAVSTFQPSDYSALLEERTVNGVCGYTLCGQPPPKVVKGREWLRAEADRRFCSTLCARKAMYVRAQLDETPAWERRGGLGTCIVLMDDSATREMPIRQRGDDDGSTLAAERGESDPASDKAKLVSDDIVEKTSSRQPRVNFDVDEFAHDSIEGYKISATKHVKHEDDK